MSADDSIHFGKSCFLVDPSQGYNHKINYYLVPKSIYIYTGVISLESKN